MNNEFAAMSDELVVVARDSAGSFVDFFHKGFILCICVDLLVLG